tara:strand:- start:480 stop:1196 length:717 start_codon:yes stop_codon:yes gene_type:complete
MTGNPSSVDPATDPSASGSGKKWATGCGIGCLVTIVLLVVLGFAGFYALKNKMDEAVTAFTSDQPVAIEMPVADEAAVEDVLQRFDAFTAAMEADEVPAPLVLTGDEINVLIFNHPNFSILVGKTKVSIEEDVLKSTVSLDLEALNIPIKFIAEKVEGRYFNGEASLNLGMAGGNPVLFLQGLEMNGAMVPDEFMNELKAENLLKEVLSDPDAQAFFDRISDLKVEDGKLTIVPKPAE